MDGLDSSRYYLSNYRDIHSWFSFHEFWYRSDSYRRSRIDLYIRSTLPDIDLCCDYFPGIYQHEKTG